MSQTPLILSGKTVAKHLLQGLRGECSNSSLRPGLTVIQIGDVAASSIYVARKQKRAEKLGFRANTIHMDESTSQVDLLETVLRCNDDPEIHGILVQLPLPKNIDEQIILDAIDPQKDVDGFHPSNAGQLSQGRSGLVPCTPKGVMKICAFYEIELSGKNAVVIGRSNIVGRPMAQLLEQANCTVTICHSRTQNLQEHLANADIVVAAVGVPNMVRGSWLKPGAVVLDVGINRLDDGSICGDVHFESASTVASAITPVPGGVGPMTIACLMENTWLAANHQT